LFAFKVDGFEMLCHTVPPQVASVFSIIAARTYALLTYCVAFQLSGLHTLPTVICCALQAWIWNCKFNTLCGDAYTCTTHGSSTSLVDMDMHVDCTCLLGMVAASAHDAGMLGRQFARLVTGRSADDKASAVHRLHGYLVIQSADQGHARVAALSYCYPCEHSNIVCNMYTILSL
jgi:hypothetical protein